jgi:hypothetical protein
MENLTSDEAAHRRRDEEEHGTDTILRQAYRAFDDSGDIEVEG